MFSRRKTCFVLIVMCLLVSAAWGDSLQLSNGSLIKGKYLGGNETGIKFQVGSTVQIYPVGDVVSISFDSASRAAASKETLQQVQPAPPPVVYQKTPELTPRPAEPITAPRTTTAAASNLVTVPAGTRLNVRMIDSVDSDRNQVGDKFQASLDDPIVVDGVTVVPKGAYVYGRLSQAKSAGKIQGRSELQLELTSLMVNGQAIPLVTGDYSVSGGSRGAQTAKRVGVGTAAGAVIGAIAGGGKGAAIGAGVGAGAGTAVQVMTKGEQVHVPSETVLDFTLQQDVKVPRS